MGQNGRMRHLVPVGSSQISFEFPLIIVPIKEEKPTHNNDSVVNFF